MLRDLVNASAVEYAHEWSLPSARVRTEGRYRADTDHQIVREERTEGGEHYVVNGQRSGIDGYVNVVAEDSPFGSCWLHVSGEDWPSGPPPHQRVLSEGQDLRVEGDGSASVSAPVIAVAGIYGPPVPELLGLGSDDDGLRVRVTLTVTEGRITGWTSSLRALVGALRDAGRQVPMDAVRLANTDLSKPLEVQVTRVDPTSVPDYLPARRDVVDDLSEVPALECAP